MVGVSSQPEVSYTLHRMFGVAMSPRSTSYRPRQARRD